MIGHYATRASVSPRSPREILACLPPARSPWPGYVWAWPRWHSGSSPGGRPRVMRPASRDRAVRPFCRPRGSGRPEATRTPPTSTWAALSPRTQAKARTMATMAGRALRLPAPGRERTGPAWLMGRPPLASSLADARLKRWRPYAGCAVDRTADLPVGLRSLALIL
jgi:hypothetical protein